jgi:hypothetical protein
MTVFNSQMLSSVSGACSVTREQANGIDNSLHGEADSHSAGQEIPCVLRNMTAD